MAIKIIKRGKTPEKKEYRVTCENCSTIFTFQPVDARLVYDFRLIGENCQSGNALIVTCPICHKQVFKYDP